MMKTSPISSRKWYSISILPFQIQIKVKVVCHCLAVEKFPFEINQSGWGEFEIKVNIYFVDPAEKSVEIIHFLKLYSD